MAPFLDARRCPAAYKHELPRQLQRLVRFPSPIMAPISSAFGGGTAGRLSSHPTAAAAQRHNTTTTTTTTRKAPLRRSLSTNSPKPVVAHFGVCRGDDDGGGGGGGDNGAGDDRHGGDASASTNSAFGVAFTGAVRHSTTTTADGAGTGAGTGVSVGAGDDDEPAHRSRPVSYTHLTLPTIYSV